MLVSLLSVQSRMDALWVVFFFDCNQSLLAIWRHWCHVQIPAHVIPAQVKYMYMIEKCIVRILWDTIIIHNIHLIFIHVHVRTCVYMYVQCTLYVCTCKYSITNVLWSKWLLAPFVTFSSKSPQVLFWQVDSVICRESVSDRAIA